MFTYLRFLLALTILAAASTYAVDNGGGNWHHEGNERAASGTITPTPLYATQQQSVDATAIKPVSGVWVKAYCTGASNGDLYVVLDASPADCVARVRECSGNPIAGGQWLETLVSPPFKTCRRL